MLALQNLSESVYKGNDKEDKVDAKGANVKINHTGAGTSSNSYNNGGASSISSSA